MTEKRENGAKPELVVDLKHWRMKEIKVWSAAVQKNDIVGIIDIIATVVKTWPHEGSPADPNAYDPLTAHEFQTLIEGVGKHVGELFRGT